MKLVLDTCVLYPNVMREMLLGAAEAGAFTPIWSDRILEEWARATHKLGPEQVLQAKGEIALLKTRWPRACWPAAPGIEQRLWLPDPADIHVLATAIDSGADGIVTLNAKDFPKGALNEEGLLRHDPDAFLRSAFDTAPDALRHVAGRVLVEANRGGGTWTLRSLMKKARLPRLGKALDT